MSNVDVKIKEVLNSPEDELLLVKNIPILSRYFDFCGITGKKSHAHKIKLNKGLTQIYIPHDKIDTFIDWYNETIRFENTVPQAYEEGYIVLENKLSQRDYKPYRKIIRGIATILEKSFYEIKALFEEFLSSSYYTGIYFKFLTDTSLCFKVFDVEEKIISCRGKLFLDKIENIGDPLIRSYALNTLEDMESINDSYDSYLSNFYGSLIVTVMWYIATNTSSKTKYVYSNKHPRNLENRSIRNIEPKDVKTLTSNIYDLSKIKIKNIDTLNRRKAGWTYSHSFEVHGHYRHYKNGKVIFIKPFIKGNNKSMVKSQKIVLKPEERVEVI